MSNWTSEILLCASRIGEAGKLLHQTDDLHDKRQVLIYLGDESQRLQKIIEDLLAPWNEKRP